MDNHEETRNEEITKKLNELIQLAFNDKTETPTQIILLALQGSRISGMDVMLAKNVQNYVADVLIPLTLRKMDDNSINLN
jgi:hypothetical protein